MAGDRPTKAGGLALAGRVDLTGGRRASPWLGEAASPRWPVAGHGRGRRPAKRRKKKKRKKKKEK